MFINFHQVFLKYASAVGQSPGDDLLDKTTHIGTAAKIYGSIAPAAQAAAATGLSRSLAPVNAFGLGKELGNLTVEPTKTIGDYRRNVRQMSNIGAGMHALVNPATTLAAVGQSVFGKKKAPVTPRPDSQFSGSGGGFGTDKGNPYDTRLGPAPTPKPVPNP